MFWSACTLPEQFTAQGDALIQGVDASPWWQSGTVAYCLERPLLERMPDSARSRGATQPELDQRRAWRKQEFIAVVDANWR